MDTPPTSRLAINAASQIMQLRVDGFPGIPNPDSILMSSADGAFYVKVPRTHFPLPTEAGDIVVVSISITRIAVEAALDQPTSSLLLPGAH